MLAQVVSKIKCILESSEDNIFVTLSNVDIHIPSNYIHGITDLLKTILRESEI